MNKVLPLLALLVLACNSCTTLANRRDLAWPSRPEGPYTEIVHCQRQHLVTFIPHRHSTGLPFIVE